MAVEVHENETQWNGTSHMVVITLIWYLICGNGSKHLVMRPPAITTMEIHGNGTNHNRWDRTHSNETKHCEIRPDTRKWNYAHWNGELSWEWNQAWKWNDVENGTWNSGMRQNMQYNKTRCDTRLRPYIRKRDKTRVCQKTREWPQHSGMGQTHNEPIKEWTLKHRNGSRQNRMGHTIWEWHQTHRIDTTYVIMTKRTSWAKYTGMKHMRMDQTSESST